LIELNDAGKPGSRDAGRPESLEKNILTILLILPAPLNISLEIREANLTGVQICPLK